MIDPESLTEKQTSFLLHQYGIDVRARVRFLRHFRFQWMFCWVPPTLALGLVWDGTPGSTAYSDKPSEFVVWCFVAFFAAGELLLWFGANRGPFQSR